MIEVWGGVECTVNRVGASYHDQLELTGHARRRDDVERIAALGIRRVRYPLLLERVAPDNLDRPDWTWVDDRLALLRALDIKPIAGLVHHGSGPRYATLLDDHFADTVARYASAVARRYPWIDAYTPVNEPLATARFSSLYGHWYPHHACDASFVKALLHQCRATSLAMAAVREINPTAQLVQTDDAGRTYSTPRLAYQAEFENHRRWLGWDLIAGRVTRHHPLWKFLRRAGVDERDLAWFAEHPCRIDIIGLNYYVTSDRSLDESVGGHPAAAVGGNGRHVYADVEAVRARGTINGHEAVLMEAWERYRTPVAITEAHLGCSREEQMRWMRDAWMGAQRARERGADVRAVTAWALFGLSDWDSLVTSLDGHYEPGAYDARAPEARPTALATVIADLVSGRTPAHPVLAGEGWWNRADAPAIVHSEAAQPVLIAGRGTLGAATARICETRGLAHVWLGRSELDIADPASVEDALQRIRPWAVVNAAGYVRVDDAERDGDRCRDSNTLGPQLLAASCARRGARLATFSSDLVFDGEKGSPYVEADAVHPLSVYGRTKADAERLVLEANADALVVRTSAFFGPWDRWNFLHFALTAMASGQSWRAPSDVRVSPTYVPDLVNAVLDLLIDGALGLWHLANAGDVSWAEFARMAAVASGYPDTLVESCAASEMQVTAPRPRYSVLGTQRGQILPPLDQALQRFVAERAHAFHPSSSPARVSAGRDAAREAQRPSDTAA